MEIISGCLIAVAVVVLFLLLVAGFSAITAYLFMLLWNFAIVDVFHASPLDFWHSWAIWIIIVFIGGAFRSRVQTKSKD